jgi:hypothetical protein
MDVLLNPVTQFGVLERHTHTHTHKYYGTVGNNSLGRGMIQ